MKTYPSCRYVTVLVATKAGATTESTSNSSLPTEYRNHWIAHNTRLIQVNQAICIRVIQHDSFYMFRFKVQSSSSYPSYIGQWSQAYVWYPTLFPMQFLPPVPKANIEGGKNWEWDCCYVRCLQVGYVVLWNANTPYNSLTLAPECTAFP